MNPPDLIGLGTVIAALSGLLGWWLTKRGQDIEEDSALVNDALKLREATQEAYQMAKKEMEDMKIDAAAMRTEMAELREEFDVLKEEVEHWRGVAFRAREQYQVERGRDPFWWQPFEPSSSRAT